MAECEAPEIIDAHHHLWRYDPVEFGWISEGMQELQRDFSVEDLAAQMQAAGIDGTVVVQARQSLAETRWLLDTARQSTSIVGVVGWVPLSDARVAESLREFRGDSLLKGVRHVVQDEPDDDFLLRPDFNRGVSALLEADLAYDLLIHERHLPQALQFARKHPQQRMVLDHLAKPRVRERELEPWRDNLRRLAECTNVSCKLSGLVTEASWTSWTLEDLRPYLDTAFEAFGPERLMAGSDWPVCLLASTYNRWWSTLYEWMRALPQPAQAQILGGTACSVYKLQAAGRPASHHFEQGSGQPLQQNA